MKRAKKMLIAIAILAIAGSVLAFKANKVSEGDWCIRTIDIPNDQTTTCPDILIGYKFKENETQGLVTYYYTTKTGENCSGKICNVTTTFVAAD